MIAHNLPGIEHGPERGKRQRLLIWLVLGALVMLLGWFGFRGYLNPELLFHFANALYC